jgi:hypothetical protein
LGFGPAEISFSQTPAKALTRTARNNASNWGLFVELTHPLNLLKTGRVSTASINKSPEPHVIHQPQQHKNR